MERTTFRRASATLVAATLLFAACSDDDTQSATGDTTTTSMMSGDGHEHSHDEGVEIGDGEAVPTVTLTAEPDSVKGVNLRIETTDFTFAPEHASTEHVAGEGHAHVYVDGEKRGRVYGEWYHLDGVDPGEHEISVDLNANSHAPLLVDGEKIEDSVTVDVPEPMDGHSHGDGFEAADPVPSVEIEVVEDPMSGYNVHVTTTDFTFTPESVGDEETTSGEGHAHLYVDGQKVGRVYGEWFHLNQDLSAGDHDIRVVLSANDHSDYVSGGDPIEATTTVMVDGEDAAPADDGTVIEVGVEGGTVEGGGRTPVSLGDTVTIRVTSDVDDHIHLHGYDVMVDVTAGGTADLTFEATIPGVFEVELEDSRVLLLELEIS